MISFQPSRCRRKPWPLKSTQTLLSSLGSTHNTIATDVDTMTGSPNPNDLFHVVGDRLTECPFPGGPRFRGPRRLQSKDMIHCTVEIQTEPLCRSDSSRYNARKSPTHLPIETRDPHSYTSGAQSLDPHNRGWVALFLLLAMYCRHSPIRS